jgi:hypothetical protein
MKSSIRDILEQEHICSVIFEHPKGYPVESTSEAGTIGIHIPYPIDEARPLLGELLVAPRGKERYVTSQSAQFQVNMVVRYQGCADGVDRSCQFALYHASESKWPKATYLVIPSGERRPIHRLRRAFVRLIRRFTRHD